MTMHAISLTNAAAQLLARIAGTTPCEKPRHTLLVGEWVEAHLSDLPAPPVQPTEQAGPEAWVRFDQEAKAWGKARLPAIEAKDSERDALRALLTKSMDKIPASPAGAVLLRAFGLGVDD